jgi:hypothetical protein
MKKQERLEKKKRKAAALVNLIKSNEKEKMIKEALGTSDSDEEIIETKVVRSKLIELIAVH